MNSIFKSRMVQGVVCAMVLGACSKQDSVTPLPRTEDDIENSSLRSSALPKPGIMNWLPSVPSVSGPAGKNVLPDGWTACADNPDPVKFPTGTSTRSALWGDPSLPWQKTLPPIPTSETSSYIVTMTTGRTTISPMLQGSKVQTKMTNLIKGAKYAIEFFVATTKHDVHTPGFVPAHTKTAHIQINTPGTTTTLSEAVDLTNHKATWVEKTMTFTAQGTEATFTVFGSNAKPTDLAYLHVFVGNNAIKQVIQ